MRVLLIFLSVCTMTQSALLRTDTELYFLQQTLNAVNLECSEVSPDLWNMQEQVKKFIQSTTQEIFQDGVFLEPYPSLAISFVKTIIEHWRESFPTQNFEYCLKINNNQGSSAFKSFADDSEDAGFLLIYDYDLIDIEITNFFFENQPCIAALMEGFLSNANFCVKKNIDKQFSISVQQKETMIHQS